MRVRNSIYNCYVMLKTRIAVNGLMVASLVGLTLLSQGVRNNKREKHVGDQGCKKKQPKGNALKKRGLRI